MFLDNNMVFQLFDMEQNVRDKRRYFSRFSMANLFGLFGLKPIPSKHGGFEKSTDRRNNRQPNDYCCALPNRAFHFDASMMK